MLDQDLKYLHNISTAPFMLKGFCDCEAQPYIIFNIFELNSLFTYFRFII